MILSRAFSIDPGWDEDMIELATWIQDDYLQPDTIKEIWQGGLIKLSALASIAEEPIPEQDPFQVVAVPNPCTKNLTFSFHLPSATPYLIVFFDLAGRHISEIAGIATGTDQKVHWDLNDRSGTRIVAGTYFYHFQSVGSSAKGKIIIW
jgi:hypothetical protein